MSQLRRQREEVEKARPSASHAQSRSPVRSQEAYKPLLAPSDRQFWGSTSNVVGIVMPVGIHDPALLGPAELSAEPYVRCPDGVVRRFPPGIDGFNNNYMQQVRGGTIYDSAAERVIRRIAGFEVSSDGRHTAFKVNDYAVSPIRAGAFNVYPLPEGKFMVPQDGFRTCTYACELMMLLDQKKIDVDALTRMEFRTAGRREMSDIVWSLERRTGIQPMMVEHKLNYKRGLFSKDDSRKRVWRDLKSKINEFGPCILSKGGHVVMLDSVREENGKFFLTIREPFHGTCLELKESAEFFRDLHGTPERTTVEAIFLPEHLAPQNLGSGRR
ncbi:hypothetical protein [Burkholderia lata]|uniref:hypothetical protein n=1 Tax=Burkholderia lata (strain ATCC 17760 / DSM 23089 / LMG 22485 / NCIMB 9086 / R18194 / 383) TaxID=482957 RepID=UPI001582A413|nr:hypothetical protein [Burkholderia lata]